MSDRTHVSISIRRLDFDRLLEAEFEGDPKVFREAISVDCDYITFTSLDDLISLEADGVNYAEWEDLEGLLAKHSIEYDKQWGRGDEYDAGKEYFRIVDGEMKSITLYEGADMLMEFLEKAKDLPPEEIKALVLKEYQSNMPFEITPLERESARAEVIAEGINTPSKTGPRRSISPRAPGI